MQRLGIEVLPSAWKYDVMPHEGECGWLTCCAVQAANAAAAAEGNAMGSANHARIEQSMASLAAAMAAMALFEQVNCCHSSRSHASMHYRTLPHQTHQSSGSMHRTVSAGCSCVARVPFKLACTAT